MKAGREGGGTRRRSRRKEGVLRPKIERLRERGRGERGLEKGKGRGRKVEEGVKKRGKSSSVKTHHIPVLSRGKSSPPLPLSSPGLFHRSLKRREKGRADRDNPENGRREEVGRGESVSERIAKSRKCSESG